MADLRAPLLFERRAEVIVDVTDGGAEANGAVDRSPVSGRVEVPENPFEFIGSDFPPLQLNRFVDPFRNHTLSIGGAYELFKMLVMVPFTLIRLLKMSGLLIAVFCIFALVVYVSLELVDQPMRQLLVGYLSVASLISMFASPLFIINLVIRTRSVEFMPFYPSQTF